MVLHRPVETTPYFMHISSQFMDCPRNYGKGGGSTPALGLPLLGGIFSGDASRPAQLPALRQRLDGPLHRGRLPLHHRPQDPLLQLCHPGRPPQLLYPMSTRGRNPGWVRAQRQGVGPGQRVRTPNGRAVRQAGATCWYLCPPKPGLRRPWKSTHMRVVSYRCVANLK